MTTLLDWRTFALDAPTLARTGCRLLRADDGRLLDREDGNRRLAGRLHLEDGRLLVTLAAALPRAPEHRLELHLGDRHGPNGALRLAARGRFVVTADDDAPDLQQLELFPEEVELRSTDTAAELSWRHIMAPSGASADS